MKTYTVKSENDRDAKGRTKAVLWFIDDNGRVSNDFKTEDRLDRVRWLFTLYKLKMCDVTDEQKREFEGLGYE